MTATKPTSAGRSSGSFTAPTRIPLFGRRFRAWCRGGWVVASQRGALLPPLQTDRPSVFGLTDVAWPRCRRVSLGALAVQALVNKRGAGGGLTPGCGSGAVGCAVAGRPELARPSSVKQSPPGFPLSAGPDGVVGVIPGEEKHSARCTSMCCRLGSGTFAAVSGAARLTTAGLLCLCRSPSGLRASPFPRLPACLTTLG